ncbi:hypothetical protein MTO96_043078 [Rhipicephalus appendiculatus]
MCTRRYRTLTYTRTTSSTTLDVTAIQAQLWHIKKGCAGFHMGSWLLWTAVVMFQVLFPVALAISTITMAVGTVVDRLICLPAQDPASESSRAVVDFLISLAIKPSARAAPDAQPDGIGRQRHATADTDSRARESSLLSMLMQGPWQDDKLSLEATLDEMAHSWPSNESVLAPPLPESIDADGKGGSTLSGRGEIRHCLHATQSRSLSAESFGEDAHTRRESVLASITQPSPSPNTTASPPPGSGRQQSAVGRSCNDLHVSDTTEKRSSVSKSSRLRVQEAINGRRHRRHHRRSDETVSPSRPRGSLQWPRSGGERNVPNTSVQRVFEGRGTQRRRGKSDTSGGSDVVGDRRVPDSDPSATSSSWQWQVLPSPWLGKAEPEDRVEISGDDVVRTWPFAVELGPQDVLDITKRFGQCSSGHMSLFKLLGEQAAVKLAQTSLGQDNAVYGLIDSRAYSAKLAEMKSKFSDGMDSKIEAGLKQKLQIGDDVKNALQPLASGGPISFDQLTQAANKATTGFGQISQTKQQLTAAATQIQQTDVKDKVQQAVQELDKITPDDETAFKEAMTDIENDAKNLTAAYTVEGKSLNQYIADNLQAWDTNKAAMKASIQSVVDSVKGLTKGFRRRRRPILQAS